MWTFIFSVGSFSAIKSVVLCHMVIPAVSNGYQVTALHALLVSVHPVYALLECFNKLSVYHNFHA